MFDFLKGKKDFESLPEDEKAKVLCEEAENLNENEEPKKAEKLYSRAFEILKNLYNSNHAKYGEDLARCCVELGETFENLEKYESAYEYYMIAEEIFDNLADEKHPQFEEDLADVHLNIGDTLFFREKYDEAEKEYLFSLDLYEKLNKKNGGSLIEDEKLIDESSGEDMDELNGRKEDLAQACADIGYAYSCASDLDDAEKYYLRAASLFHELATVNAEEYAEDLVSQYKDLSILYSDMKRPELAEEYKRKAKNPGI